MTKDRTYDPSAEDFSGAEGVPGPYLVGLSQTIFDALFNAAMSPEPEAARRVLGKAKAIGVSSTQLADQYIPALAHKMGDMWCADTMGFAEVTIGVARLQALLRELGPEWRADVQAPADAPVILLLTLRDAQHTLGAVLLAGQLRRAGYSVRLALDPTQAQFADLAQRLRFDAVFISASQSESLEKMRRMVDLLKEVSVTSCPIAVGGGVLEFNTDVAKIVGADIATSNIDEAVEYCGLIKTNKNSATRAPGT